MSVLCSSVRANDWKTIRTRYELHQSASCARNSRYMYYARRTEEKKTFDRREQQLAYFVIFLVFLFFVLRQNVPTRSILPYGLAAAITNRLRTVSYRYRRTESGCNDYYYFRRVYIYIYMRRILVRTCNIIMCNRVSKSIEKKRSNIDHYMTFMNC